MAGCIVSLILETRYVAPTCLQSFPSLVVERRRSEEKREREDSLAGGLLARGEAKSESIRRLSSRHCEAIEPEALTFASDRPE